MRGERVLVVTREPIGTDGMGEPTYEFSAVEVEDVLVSARASEDVGEPGREDGYALSYRLAFPKSFEMPAATLAHAMVVLPERGGSLADRATWLEVVGNPDVTRPCPTRWNRLVSARRVDG